MLNCCVAKTSLTNRAASPCPCGRMAPLDMDDQLVPALPELPEALRGLCEPTPPVAITEIRE